MLPDSRLGAAAFLLVRTQWNYAPSGMPTGLRYADCMATWRAHARELGVSRSGLAALMADVQEIEASIIEVARERAEEERAKRTHGHP
ncbi:hypothetical protein EIM50_13735 [Pseudoxanthomonas sp. SGD-10]|nr:hypothetical protein EIM50_13735 [Pseudoxanthomonas sp. SGD-10]